MHCSKSLKIGIEIRFNKVFSVDILSMFEIIFRLRAINKIVKYVIAEVLDW